MAVVSVLPEGVAVYGDRGYILIGNRNWKAFDPEGQVVAEDSGGNSGLTHIQNFIECIKSREKPNADLETVGHISSVLCHAGNVAWRVGRKLFLDPDTERFVPRASASCGQTDTVQTVSDAEANAFRSRTEYRRPWLLPEV
jgi:hypothetical protein